MTDFLNRATVKISETKGRTLSGVAMPWDKVAMVRDLVRGRVTPPYPEAFSPSSTDKTRSEHTTFPVFVGHDPESEPIGVVSFSRSQEALMFDAPLSKTPRADNFLELANDGAMRSVSIQFRPVKAVQKVFTGVREPVTYRTEVGLRHLALAPTGYGQYEDAQVHAIRTEVEEMDAAWWLELERAERAWYNRILASRRVRAVDLDALFDTK
jgi:phage head maturation protease